MATSNDPRQLPPELRGADEYETDTPASSVPPWVRLTALLIIVAVFGAYVASYFFS